MIVLGTSKKRQTTTGDHQRSIMTSTNICPFCLRENELGASQCAHCGVSLKNSHTDAIAPRLKAQRQSAILADRARCLDLPVDTAVGDVALFIDEIDEPIIIPRGTQMTLGRYSEESDASLIDLTAYGAIENGVSRQHALLTVKEEQITLIDLNSTNGTWHNRERLLPGKGSALQSGDRIMLARLSILVCVYTGQASDEIRFRLKSTTVDSDLTPQFLAEFVVPFLNEIAAFHAILSDWQNRKTTDMNVISMTALPGEGEISIHLTGATDSVRLVEKWLTPQKIAWGQDEPIARPTPDSIQRVSIEIGKKMIEDTAVPADANLDKITPILTTLLTNPLTLLLD